MRVLFTFTGGRGHLEPLLPLAAAAAAAGHETAIAGGAGPLAAVDGPYETFALEDAGGPPERIPLRPVDLDRERADFRDGFADRTARRRAAAVPALLDEWRPDVVVCEETDFGSMLAAERLGVPRATVVVLAARTFATPELVAAPLDAVRAEHGLPPDPQLERLAGELVLAPFPAVYRDPGAPLPGAHHYRPGPAPARGDGGAPLVYVTLGTVFNVESGDLLARVVEGVRELPVEVVATVGPYVEPAELGPQPQNVRVERYVPQAEVLARARAVVSHGGSGSVLGALAHGLPMVLTPLGADQPFNAGRCEALGVARVLDAVEATPADVRDAVASVLAEPSYGAAAGRVADAFARLPGPDSAVARLERLAALRA